MRKGFLLTADNKEKKRRAQNYEKRHDETKPLANDGAGLSMKQGFLLRSSPTATRRKCTQKERLSGRKGFDDRDATKATPPPQPIGNRKLIVASTSAALLDLEENSDGAPPNDDIVSSPALINFIASSVESNEHRDDEISNGKQPPIMVEIDDGPVTVIEERTVDDVGRVDSANDADVCRKENAANANDTAAIELDSFAFASEVSQVLSSLRRALKSNDQFRRKDETNNSLIGVRQVMNQKSEKLVKAFVEKHIICIDASAEKELRLQQIWRTVLQQIAQESPKKKKKRSAYSVSSQFALGIGILMFSKPIGVALESIAGVLSNLASSIVAPISCDEEKEKRHKIETIGAILLVQCHFRCMSIETSEEETVINEFDRIRIEASTLLNKIIPALQSIVVNGQKRTYLTSTASDAFFELIEIIPRLQSIGFHSSIASPQVIWKDILPRIEEMIDVKRLWTTKNEGATTSEKRVIPTLFYNAPYEVILPPLLDYISHTCSSTSISCLLCNVMEASAKNHADDFVACLIISAQRHKNGKSIFENNGENWKSLLLESVNDFAYRNILLATAKSMVDMPSSTIPLSLFSSLVGMTNDLDKTDSEQKILKATVSVVRFAVDELRLPRDFHNRDEQAVFKRFSPLLILRRLPKAYYQILHKHIVSDTESSRTVVHELAKELANEIRAHALNNDEGNLAREEKLLLAQVAGHCLPFSVTSSDLNELPIALFDLCERPFSDTLANMRCTSKSSLDLQNIHESKLALFAVCQHIPGASDEGVSGTVFVKVALLVFEFLYESQTTCGGEHTGQELTKLHTGCLHFLGVVFDSLFARKAKSSVEQIEPEAKNCRNKFLDGLMKTFDDTISIVFYGAIPELEGRCFSASTRVSIFNAMVAYSQSCTTEDQRLALFASELLPALIKWVDEGAIDDEIRHPLCVAASLQVVYTILARLGSFDWVSENESKFVRLTLRCALKSLCNEEGAGICSPLRLVSVKVILTVIAIKQDLAEYFERDEIRRAVVVVRGAVNRDESQEVRQLAFKILPYLEHMIDS